MHRDAEPACGPGGEREVSVVCLGDALDDCQTEADTCVVCADAYRAALCQIHNNEPWHYEVRPEAIDHGCPLIYADPTHDPRTQQ